MRFLSRLRRLRFASELRPGPWRIKKRKSERKDGGENAGSRRSGRVAAAVPLPRVAVPKDTANKFKVVLVEV